MDERLEPSMNEVEERAHSGAIASGSAAFRPRQGTNQWGLSPGGRRAIAEVT